MAVSTIFADDFQINVTQTDVAAYGLAATVTLVTAFPSVGFFLLNTGTHLLLRFIPTLIFVYSTIHHLPEITKEVAQVSQFILQPRIAGPLYVTFLASPIVWNYVGQHIWAKLTGALFEQRFKLVYLSTVLSGVAYAYQFFYN